MRIRYLFVFVTIILVASTAYGRWFQDKQDIGGVVFSHDVHFEALGANCEYCHNDVFYMVTKKNPTYTMEDMEKGKSCGACHNGKRAFSVKGDCISCHADEVVWEGDEIGKTAFKHSIHLDMEYSCDDCHPDLFKMKKGSQKMTMASMNKGEYCGACHDGDSAFSVKGDCITCHVGAIEITMTDDATGETVFSHSVHLGMDYSCGDCHPDLFKPKQNGQTMTMAAMEKGEYCGACHDGDSAFSVKGDCATCHAGDLSWENKAIGDTIFSHSTHIEMGYLCDDCHPDLFVPKHKAQTMKMDSMSKRGEYCGACHDGDTAFSIKRDCDVCHIKKK